ncbi:MAG TPA: protein kinase [Pyrinomonadaceae bacterium]|nr:protein kinase [Pyrinomonadaceae bacterium]
MTPERWQQIEGLFQAALERGESERASFLDHACESDGQLRNEVESMLHAHEASGDFLTSSALDVAARGIANSHEQDARGRLLGHYRIEQLIGSGGMGEVFAATDTRTNRRVALKVLPDYFVGDAQRVLRFEQEARAVLTLNHPNIVTIYEVDKIENSHFIATEFIEGETLRQRLARAPLAVPEVLEIAIQICEALVAANRAGIVHRDIKPENIMLRPDGYVKVLDFGIAKLAGPDAALVLTTSTDQLSMTSTNPGIMLGTVRYMSPEQTSGLEVDARSDIWSLGVVLYEMLSGNAPFNGDTPADCAAAIRGKQAETLANGGRAIPPELQWVINKTLRKNRAERYQTGPELLSDLRELEQELHLRSRLETPPGRSLPGTASRARRITGYLATHRWQAAAVVALLLLLALGAWKYLPARSPAINSLAVLPFVNVSSELGSEYVADGVTENLINSLSQIPNLKVIARNSVFRYKVHDPQSGVPDPQKVAHELGVQAILIGRIIQHGDDLFVSAELVSADDNSHLWGAQYSRKVSDVFAVEEQIAQDISSELRSKLAGDAQPLSLRRDTANLKALEYYMQGRSYINRRTREDLLMAGSYYQKAIEEDQNYALAYAGLAEVYGNLSVRGYISPAEGQRKLDEAARKAVALDPNLAEGHVMMGFRYMACAPYDFANGDREIRRALELRPSLAMGHLFLALSLFKQSRLDEGLNEMLRARDLDPFSAIIARQVALYYLLKRDYPRALQILRQADQSGPPFTTSTEIDVYIQNQLYDETLNRLENESRTRKGDSLLICDRGMVYAAQNRPVEAQKVVAELEKLSGLEYGQAQCLAKIYSSMKENELAFIWLERGLKTGALGVFYKDDPVWDNIRSDPRFANLLPKLGIPQQKAAG